MNLIPLHSERGDEQLRVTCICHFTSYILDVLKMYKENEGNFVIQGEGRGHLTQALALKQMLLHEGHEVVKV